MIEEAIALWFCLSVAAKIAIRCWKFYVILRQSADQFFTGRRQLRSKAAGAEHILPAYLEQLGVEYKIVEETPTAL